MTRRRHPARGATPTSTMRIARRGDAVAASAAAPAALRRGALFLATPAAGVLAVGACRDGGRGVRDESQAPGRGAAERTSRAGEVEPAGSAPLPASFSGAARRRIVRMRASSRRWLNGLAI